MIKITRTISKIGMQDQYRRHLPGQRLLHVKIDRDLPGISLNILMWMAECLEVLEKASILRVQTLAVNEELSLEASQALVKGYQALNT